jgi:hypothetical protein
MDRNPGSKFVYIHIWNNADYALVDQSQYRKTAGPVRADIYGANNQHPPIATIGFSQFQSGSATKVTTYRPDGSVPVNTTGTWTVTPGTRNGMNHYSITISATPPPGRNCTDVCGIVWSTQANSANSHIHCSALCQANTPGSVAVNGGANCTTASFNVNIINSGNKAVTVTSLDIYADNGGSMPNDGSFNPGSDTKFNSGSNFMVAANSTFTYNGSIPSQYMGYDLWAQVVLSNGTTILQLLRTTECAALPIKIKSFDASRSKQTVAVKWTTASEQDIRGFNVQRMTDDGTWKTVAFVPSQSNGGNSSTALSYQYTDLNTYRGVSQYRLQEVAQDGKAGLSDVRMVRGEEQAGKIVMYPNPSSDGKVNLVFENTSSRDITVSDMSGRVIKQFKSVSASSLSIDNLNAGFYSVQVLDRTTNETSVEKLIIKMR